MINTDEVYQIIKMVDYFKGKRQSTNSALYETGEGHRCKPLTSISIEDIRKYCHEQLGLGGTLS